MNNRRTYKELFNLFFKGLIMGAANKVPGISGGTVSFVLGFYQELISSFEKINLKAFRLIIDGRFRTFFNYVNSPFILSVFSGSIFSYFSVSLILDFFLKNYELYVWSWFFGLIIGSAYCAAKDFDDWNFKNCSCMVVGALIGLGVSYLTPATENEALWYVFVCGIIGVSGMTLPGLSGSFILILMGNYVLLLVDTVNILLGVLREILIWNFDFIHNPEKMKYIKIIAVFLTGSTFGMISLSHLIGYALKRWNQIVTAVIVGFIVGSLGIVWPWKEKIFKQENGEILVDQNGNEVIENYQRSLPNMAEPSTWYALLYIFSGVILLLLVDYYGKRRQT